MDDESSLLKPKLYLISYDNDEQKQDQQQLPAKYKKYGSLKGLPTYASGLTIGRNPNCRTINPVEFIGRLVKENQVLERQYDREGDKKTLSESIRTGSSGPGRHETLPVKSTSPRSRYQQGCAKQARRKRQSRATEVSKPSSYATPQGGRADQARRGDGKHPHQINKPNRVMEHTPRKNSRSPLNSATKPCRLSRGSYQDAITPRKRFLK